MDFHGRPASSSHPVCPVGGIALDKDPSESSSIAIPPPCLPAVSFCSLAPGVGVSSPVSPSQSKSFGGDSAALLPVPKPLVVAISSAATREAFSGDVVVSGGLDAAIMPPGVPLASGAQPDSSMPDQQLVSLSYPVHCVPPIRRSDEQCSLPGAVPSSGLFSHLKISNSAVSCPPSSLDRAASKFDSNGPDFPPLPILSCSTNPVDSSLPSGAVDDVTVLKAEDAKCKAHSSWASLVIQAPSISRLSYVKPISLLSDGKPRFKLPSSVAQKGAPIWKNTLVGFFLDKLPFSLVQSCALRLWGKTGLTDVLSNGNGFFFFKFADASCALEVLNGGPWYFGGRPIFLKLWSPCMNLSKEGCKSVPIWAHFYNVPLEYWTEEGLSYIASTVGRPLHADTMTSSLKRLCYARICIEIGIEDSLPNAFDLEMEDGSLIEIQIEYNWVPKKCSVCKEFGHLTKNCKKACRHVWVPKSTQASSVPATDGAWTQVKCHGKTAISDLQTLPTDLSFNGSPAKGLGRTSNSFEILHLDNDPLSDRDVTLVQSAPSVAQLTVDDSDKRDGLATVSLASCSAVPCNTTGTDPGSDWDDVSPSSSNSSTPLLAKKLNMIDEVEKKLGKKNIGKKKVSSSGNSRGKFSKKFR